MAHVMQLAREGALAMDPTHPHPPLDRLGGELPSRGAGQLAEQGVEGQSRGQSRGSHPQLDPQLDAHHAQLDEQPDPAGQEEPEASHEDGAVKEHGWPSTEAERSRWAKRRLNKKARCSTQHVAEGKAQAKKLVDSALAKRRQLAQGTKDLQSARRALHPGSPGRDPGTQKEEMGPAAQLAGPRQLEGPVRRRLTGKAKNPRGKATPCTDIAAQEQHGNEQRQEWLEQRRDGGAADSSNGNDSMDEDVFGHGSSLG